MARPLRELYPSLYLQNLKGHVMRTTTYEEFLVEQEQRDRAPELATKGQVFNFNYLERHLSGAGAKVRWMRYSSSHLLRDVVLGVSGLISDSLAFDAFRQLPPPTGTNPRRSLHFSVAEQARCLNLRFRAGELSSEERQIELTRLLDQSEQIRVSDPSLSQSGVGMVLGWINWIRRSMEPSGNVNSLNHGFSLAGGYLQVQGRCHPACHEQRKADICQFGVLIGVSPWLHRNCCP